MDRPRRSSLLMRASVAAFATLVMACSTAAAGPLASPSPSSQTRTFPVAAAPSSATATATHDHSATATATATATTQLATVAASSAPATAVSPTLAPTAAPTAPAATPTPAPVSAGPIAVTLLDVSIRLDRSATAAGSVTFTVKNAGTVIHQLVVLKTDIAQNQIPPSSTQPGTMTEPGFVTQTPLIDPGASFTLTLAMTSGSYVLMCNQPAHYLIGMHTGFLVN